MALLPTDPKKQKLLIALLAPWLGVAGYWYALHGRYVAENAELEARLPLLEARNASARERAVRAGPELQQKVDEYRRHMSILERLIPRDEEIPELLNDMTLRARETGVDLVMLRPESQVSGPFYDHQVYAVGVVGGYHEIAAFLSAVGSLPRIVTATDLRLERRRQDGRGDITLLEATFRLQTYVLPATAPALEVESNGRT